MNINSKSIIGFLCALMVFYIPTTHACAKDKVTIKNNANYMINIHEKSCSHCEWNAKSASRNIPPGGTQEYYIESCGKGLLSCGYEVKTDIGIRRASDKEALCHVIIKSSVSRSGPTSRHGINPTGDCNLQIIDRHIEQSHKSQDVGGYRCTIDNYISVIKAN